MREIPIADFLNAMGVRPAKQRGQVLWYSAPYRTERTPSFKVDTVKNVWFDFGTGKGGDIFDLAGAFIGSEDFLLRAAFIARNGACPRPVMTQLPRNKEGEPAFEDIWVRSLQDSKLLGYLEERGIDAHVAIPNCEEVRYCVHGKRYYAIGFRNRNGGLELRNRFFKGCIPPKDISLKRSGADVCAVFEGFMDYLSAMQLGIIASDWLPTWRKLCKCLATIRGLNAILTTIMRGEELFKDCKNVLERKLLTVPLCMLTIKI